MAAVRSRRVLTLDDYFDIELRSEARHNALAANLVARLRGGGCRVLCSARPSCSLAAGRRPRRTDSTRDYDRGEKLRRYQRMPSLRAVLLVEPSVPRIERWARSPADEWARSDHVCGDVELPGCGAHLSVDEVYEGLEGLPD